MTKTNYMKLVPHSYHYCEYDNHDSQSSFGYTYIRKPDPKDRTRYTDRYVTHIEMRPDVRVLSNNEKGAEATWHPDMPCPFVRMEE